MGALVQNGLNIIDPLPILEINQISNKFIQ